MFSIIKNNTLIFCTIVTTIFIPFFATQEKNKLIPMEIIKASLYGGFAGMTEVATTGQTLTFIKNMKQQGKGFRAILKTVWENPRASQAGLAINIACMVPATAGQVAVDTAIKEMLPSNDVVSAIVRNTFTGTIPAPIPNVIELIIINQQNHKTGALKTIQKLYCENGIKTFGRGFLSKATRDSIFCMGFLTFYPDTKTMIEKQLGSFNKTGFLAGFNDIAAIIAAACLVGGPTALISHPFDTMSTWLQADPSKEKIKGYADILKIIRAQGVGKLLLGWEARALRVAFAIPIMTGAKDCIKSICKSQN